MPSSCQRLLMSREMLSRKRSSPMEPVRGMRFSLCFRLANGWWAAANGFASATLRLNPVWRGVTLAVASHSVALGRSEVEESPVSEWRSHCRLPEAEGWGLPRPCCSGVGGGVSVIKPTG